MGLLADFKVTIFNVNLQLDNRTKKKKTGVVSEQTSLFLHGAEGTGKTIMFERATGKPVEELDAITRTLGGRQPTQLIETKDGLTLIADHSGEPTKEEMINRMNHLNSIKPLALLLLLDHAPRDHDSDSDYKCPKDRELPKDRAHPIQRRVRAHKKAIQELAFVFRANPILAERCRIVIPIINKRDAWEKLGYDISVFTYWYFDALTELTRALTPYSVKLHQPIPLAGKWEGFGDALKIIGKEAGKEWVIKFSENPFVKIDFRIPKTKKSRNL